MKTKEEWIRDATMAGEADPLSQIFTPREAANIVWAMMDGREITAEEGDRILHWCEQAKLDATMLELILAGRVGVSFPEHGEITLHKLRAHT